MSSRLTDKRVGYCPSSRRVARRAKLRRTEQLYVDRFSSIGAQLVYKKSRKLAAWPSRIDRYGLGMRCGHDPCFSGVYARKILLTGNILEFEYGIVEVADDPRHLVLQTKRQSLTVTAWPCVDGASVSDP